MKSKKAILVPELMKIIIAVFSLLILFYLLASIVGLGGFQTERQQAKNSLEDIIIKINDVVERGEGATNTYLVTGPKDWFFHVDQGGSCKEGSCVCFCPSAGSIIGPQPECEDSQARCESYMPYEVRTLRGHNSLQGPFYLNTSVELILLNQGEHVCIFTSEWEVDENCIAIQEPLTEDDIIDAIYDANFYP